MSPLLKYPNYGPDIKALGERFDNFDAKFEAFRQDVGEGFKIVSETFVLARENFDTMSRRFDQQDERMGEVQNTLKRIDNKLDGVMEVVNKIQGDVYKLNAR